MKVLLIDVYNYNKGGAETVCFNTGRMLEEHGHEVVYFTLKWERNEPSPQSKYFPESKETRRGPLRQARNLVNYFYSREAARNIERLIRDERPDIAHIHLMWGQITGSILPVLRRHGVPVLFTVHDYRLVCPAYTFRDGRGRVCEACRGRHFYRCLTHNCCKGSRLMSAVMAAEQYIRNAFFNPAEYFDGFIYVSNFAKEIQERYMPAVRRKPSVTLYNFSTAVAAAPKRLPEDRYFLYFGRLSYEKGVRTLLEAFRGLPQCRLKIAGTGPKEDGLKAFAWACGMDNVEFLGYKRGRELEELVAGACFVVVPSEWYENNPMTVIEAYSAGTPVIGARIGGIPEIVVEAQTGFQFRSGDADDLCDVLSKAAALGADDYHALSAGALRFAAENFAPGPYYERLVAFYRRFV